MKKDSFQKMIDLQPKRIFFLTGIRFFGWQL